MRNATRITVVWLLLLVLLALSVASARLDLGIGNLLLNLALSAAMAALIGWFYMHLENSSLLIRSAAVVALLWIALLIGLALGDYLTRAPPVGTGGSGGGSGVGAGWERSGSGVGAHAVREWEELSD